MAGGRRLARAVPAGPSGSRLRTEPHVPARPGASRRHVPRSLSWSDYVAHEWSGRAFRAGG